MAKQSERAFTLVEISIVLVIIGLLVGGVLVGRDLIKSAEIRAQISQIEELKTAVNTFKVKYNYLPGDMPPSEASQLGFFTYTGAFAGKGCTVVSGYSYGNNDGIINGSYEYYPFWSHLSDAKLVKGTYGGTAGNLLKSNTSACGMDAGNPITSPSTTSEYLIFVPMAKISTFVGIQGNFYESPKMTRKIYITKKDNMFNIFDLSSNSISAHDAYMIDSKMDDGLPTSGDVRINDTSDWSGGIIAVPPCTTSVTPLQYDLSPATADTKNCYAMDFLF